MKPKDTSTHIEGDANTVQRGFFNLSRVVSNYNLEITPEDLAAIESSVLSALEQAGIVSEKSQETDNAVFDRVEAAIADKMQAVQSEMQAQGCAHYKILMRLDETLRTAADLVPGMQQDLRTLLHKMAHVEEQNEEALNRIDRMQSTLDQIPDAIVEKISAGFDMTSIVANIIQGIRMQDEEEMRKKKAVLYDSIMDVVMNCGFDEHARVKITANCTALTALDAGDVLARFFDASCGDSAQFIKTLYKLADEIGDLSDDYRGGMCMWLSKVVITTTESACRSFVERVAPAGQVSVYLARIESGLSERAAKSAVAAASVAPAATAPSAPSQYGRPIPDIVPPRPTPSAPPQAASTATAQADAQAEVLEFRMQEDGTYNVYTCARRAVEVIVPTTYQGVPVTAIDQSAFENCSRLKRVSLPAGLRTVGKEAFNNCTALAEIGLPASVTDIGDRAFNNCTALTSLRFPAGVTHIGAGVINYCDKLTSVKVDGGNAVYRAVDNCLVHVATHTLAAACRGGVIPTDGSVQIIGERAFFGDEALRVLRIPVTVVDIADSAFGCCNALTEVHLPATVRSLGKLAFGRCRSLEHIYFAGTAEEWGKITKHREWDDGSKAYTMHYDDKSGGPTIPFIVPPKRPSAPAAEPTSPPKEPSRPAPPAPKATTPLAEGQFADAQQLVYTPLDGGTCEVSGYRGSDGVVSIPFSCQGMPVKSVGDGAFAGSSLSRLTFSRGVLSIGKRAFAACQSLFTVSIEDKVMSIGEAAFEGCEKLQHIHLPRELTTLGAGAFRGCTALGEVCIPPQVSVLAANTFEGCTSLRDIYLPASITAVERNVFAGCTALKAVYFAGTAEQWKAVKGKTHIPVEVKLG